MQHAVLGYGVRGTSNHDAAGHRWLRPVSRQLVVCEGSANDNRQSSSKRNHFQDCQETSEMRRRRLSSLSIRVVLGGKGGPPTSTSDSLPSWTLNAPTPARILRGPRPWSIKTVLGVEDVCLRLVLILGLKDATCHSGCGVRGRRGHGAVDHGRASTSLGASGFSKCRARYILSPFRI